MNVSALLEKIARRQHERRQSREADFRALVAQIADGLEPDAEAIEQVLGGNQKTLDDLREAVELLQRRRELRRAVDEAPRLASERKRVEKEIAKADRAFKAAEAKYEAVAQPLHARLRQLKTLTSKAEEARRELWKTCGDEELRKRLDEVTGPLDELTRRLGATECNARKLRYEANAERDDARLAAREPNARAHTEEAARCDDEARQLESELPALRRKVASLEKQERAIREQMLEP